MADSSNGILPAWGCNICYEESRDPVCTTCGHLFCWPCLYKWIHHGGLVPGVAKSCPVCRFRFRRGNINVIPVYVTTQGRPVPPPAGAAAPIIPPRPPPPPEATTWAELEAYRETMRQQWRQEAVNHARRAGAKEGIAQMQRLVDADSRSLDELRRQLCAQGMRSAQAMATAMSQAPASNARTSSGNSADLAVWGRDLSL